MYKVYGITKDNCEKIEKKLKEQGIVRWFDDSTLDEHSISNCIESYKFSEKFILELDDDYQLSLEADDEIVSVEEFLGLDKDDFSDEG